MGKSAAPTSTDLDSFLTAAGFTLGTLDTATAAAAGVDEFQRRTNRVMLAPAGTVLRYFDPVPYRDVVEFGQAMAATITLVQYKREGETATTLTSGTDYWALPYEDPSEERGGWTALRLASRWVGQKTELDRRAVQVTGRWGWYTSIPEDAWTAMLLFGAALLAPSRGLVFSGGYVSTDDTGVRREYGVDPLGAARKAWLERANATVQRYRAVSLG